MDTLTAELTPSRLADILQEPEKALLGRVLKTIGQERCAVILVDALAIESNGGLLVKAGDRRRTPGGVFFHLVRQQCTKEERRTLFPYRVLKRPPVPDTLVHCRDIGIGLLAWLLCLVCIVCACVVCAWRALRRSLRRP